MEETNDTVVNSESTKITKNKKVIIIVIIIITAILLITGSYFLFIKNIIVGNTKNIAGYYELYEMSSEENNYTYDELQSLKNLGLIVTLELNEDKTGKLNMFGETKDLTYDNKKMTVDEEESTPYKEEDGKISMKQDGEKLVFQKTEKTNNSEK